MRRIDQWDNEAVFVAEFHSRRARTFPDNSIAVRRNAGGIVVQPGSARSSGMMSTTGIIRRKLNGYGVRKTPAIWHHTGQAIRTIGSGSKSAAAEDGLTGRSHPAKR